LGIGDWGFGDWGLGPIPNPQSPIPNPQSPFFNLSFDLELNKFLNKNIKNILLKYRKIYTYLIFIRLL
jgi:hypothetical protein